MTAILFDGFDHDDTRDVWTSAGPSAIDTSPVRTGTRSRVLSSGGVGPYHAFDPQEDDVIWVGFGFNHSSTLVSTAQTMLIFSEASNLSKGHVGLIRRPSTRGWEIRRAAEVDDAADGILLGEVTPNKWFPDSWHHMEFGARIHDSTGWVELRQDGVTILSATNIDTRDGGTDGLIDLIAFNQRTNAGIFNIDDVSIINEQGSVNNTWLGDTRMFPLYPAGNGFYLMWVGSDGNSVDNYLLVDEVGTPVTSDYVGSENVGDIDTYEFGDLPVTVGTIRGIEIRMHAAKSDTGTKQLRSVTRRAGSDAFGDDKALAAVPLWQSHRQIDELDPLAGPGAWTIANINATEWGQQVRS